MLINVVIVNKLGYFILHMFYLRNKASVNDFVTEYFRDGENVFEIEILRRFKQHSTPKQKQLVEVYSKTKTVFSIVINEVT